MTRRSPGYGSVYLRGKTYWISYVGPDGTRVQESARTRNERQGQAYLAERLRQVRQGTWQPQDVADASPHGLTVSQYAAGWFETRERPGRAVETINAERRVLTRWFVEPMADKPIGEVTAADLAACVRQVVRRDGEPAAARTKLTAYAFARALFGSAHREGLIVANPCTLSARRGELPKKVDADPRWREGAVFSREEVEALISTPSVPPRQRVYYALLALAGLRSGEAHALRWSSWDAKQQPLGALLVSTQASSQTGERRTKTLATRRIPVHPTLALVLDEWKREGFAFVYGRHPSKDDLIVPSPRDVGSFASKAEAAALTKVMRRLRMRAAGRNRHALRATFISLCLRDGGRRDLVRFVTHAPNSQDAFDVYHRPEWADLCREVARLQVTLPRVAEVVSLPMAVASGSGSYNPSYTADKTPAIRLTKAPGGAGPSSARSCAAARCRAPRRR